jgi:hypothetical protein
MPSIKLAIRWAEVFFSWKFQVLRLFQIVQHVRRIKELIILLGSVDKVSNFFAKRLRGRRWRFPFSKYMTFEQLK